MSVALQALVVISMGSIADHGKFTIVPNNIISPQDILAPHRKPLLLSFAGLGSLNASLFLFLPSSSYVWYLSSVLAIAANVGFGVSIVAMNAYLPALAQESPEVLSSLHDLENYDDLHAVTDRENNELVTENPTAPLLSSGPQRISEHRKDLESRYQILLARETSRISSLGIALGYGAGICLLALTLIPVNRLQGSTFALRLAIGLSGVWWFVFSIPASLLLPSPPAPTQGMHEFGQKEWSFKQSILSAWIGLVNNLRWREVKKLTNTYKFLAAWFLLSDGKSCGTSLPKCPLMYNNFIGFSTITSTALLFGKTTLHMSPSSLIIVGVLTPLSGIIGSLLWPIVQRKYQWSSLKILIILVIMASMIPAYGCLGFITQGRVKFGGLTTQAEMFALAVYFGQ